MAPVPYADIDTVFLDVGNTLISIDFDRVATELTARQLPCEPAALRRAEAAARPGYSERVFVTGVRSDRSLFHSYLSAILEHSPGDFVPPDPLTPSLAGTPMPRSAPAARSHARSLASLSAAELDELVTELGPVLRPDGRASALWRMVMPGVPAALERLQRQGLTLAVVSNSDGTCAQSLEEAGLLRYMNFVIDSAEVGVEKPDPRIFAIALARCGADPRRTLYVGDLYHADVVGARGAGLHALLLDPNGDWPPLDCDRAQDLAAVADRLELARASRTGTQERTGP
jgi:HAD superfamily hydrolase (TIGR01509 family)